MSELVSLTIGETTYPVVLSDECPITVHNFKQLVYKEFYNGLSVFEKIPNLLLKTGCPFNNGTGHANYFIDNESSKVTQKFKRGSLGMCNSGPGSESCQFFIYLGDGDKIFDSSYTLFGQIVEEPTSLDLVHIGTKIKLTANDLFRHTSDISFGSSSQEEVQRKKQDKT